MLNDLTLTLASVAYDDEGHAYPITQTFRYDFQGTAVELAQIIEQHPSLFVEGSQMANT